MIWIGLKTWAVMDVTVEDDAAAADGGDDNGIAVAGSPVRSLLVQRADVGGGHVGGGGNGKCGDFRCVFLSGREGTSHAEAGIINC